MLFSWLFSHAPQCQRIGPEYRTLLLASCLTLLTSAALQAHAAGTDDVLLSENDFLSELPIVLSASRLPQSAADAPVATTIIDRQAILASGFTEIPDLLRLAPGFIVSYDGGNIQAVGYHMLANRYSRQMQVLVDGRSVYEPAQGGVAWADLPLTIDDIERIEVIRGPNAATYGSNSFTSVINIITRHAILDRGLMLKTNLGSDGLAEGFVRYGGNHKALDYRITAAYLQNDGFDGRYDDKRVRLITLRGDYEIDFDNTLMVQLGHSSGPKGQDNVFDARIAPHDRETYSQFQQLKWTRTLSADAEFSFQFYHNQNKDIDNYLTRPVLALGGLQVNIDERRTADRYDIEFQNILQPLAPLRLVWGLGARKDSVNGPAFFNTRNDVDNRSCRVFSNVEYQLSEKTLVNAGIMYENSDTGGAHASPRLSLNRHLHPDHTVRVSASRAYRDPLVFEQSPDYRVPPVLPGNVLLFDAGNLASERITAYEIGYIGRFPGISTTLDARYFYEELDRLITFSPTPYLLGLDGTALRFLNSDNIRIKGIEVSVQYRSRHGTRLNLNYTHQDVNGTDTNGTVRFRDSGPPHILNALAMHDFAHGYSASAGFYYQSDMKQLESNDKRPDQKRVDLRLARTISTAGQNFTLAVAVQNLFNRTPETRLLNIIDRRIYGSLAVSFK